MRIIRILPLVALVVAAACSTPDATQPELDDLLATAEAKPQTVACRAFPLRPNVQGKIKAQDCLFGVDQREDLYQVDQARLGVATPGGDQMLTFTGEAEFDAIFGLGGDTDATFPDPVYAFRIFDAGQVTAPNGFVINAFSLIGGEPTYKMFFGGRDADQLGKYSLTTEVEPTTNTCVKGHRVYLQGNGSFSSSISNENACRTTVAFGPNVGAEINVQWWWIRMSGGETLTLTLDGVTDATVAAAIIDFGPSGQFALDLGDGAGDADRSVTFTAPYRSDFYVEVSSVPDVVSPYTLTFDGPDTP